MRGKISKEKTGVQKTIEEILVNKKRNLQDDRVRNELKSKQPSTAENKVF